jgi:AcrR family transcriptional regulator
MATPPKGLDRRAQRTRQMLRQAFIEVVQEKGMLTASVQEITERANVSRGTFYAHYADKYALVDAIIREEFQRLVNTLPLAAGRNRETFHLLIRAVLEYFTRVYQRHHLSPALASLVEQSTHEELTALITTWLKQGGNEPPRSRVPVETVAQMMSWAIFGAAAQWSQETTTLTSAHMADTILLVLVEGVGSLIPEAFGM